MAPYKIFQIVGIKQQNSVAQSWASFAEYDTLAHNIALCANQTPCHKKENDL
ncbi:MULTISPECIES: hypothetical protein [Photobacterium]|uniref:hypothetical protein n=1 Tax=Photobacterium TaxID=657 RepID=UPI001304C6C8|nr:MULTISPECIES: hypothetical protein [Photobacterium]